MLKHNVGDKRLYIGSHERYYGSDVEVIGIPGDTLDRHFRLRNASALEVFTRGYTVRVLSDDEELTNVHEDSLTEKV